MKATVKVFGLQGDLLGRADVELTEVDAEKGKWVTAPGAIEVPLTHQGRDTMQEVAVFSDEEGGLLSRTRCSGYAVYPGYVALLTWPSNIVSKLSASGWKGQPCRRGMRSTEEGRQAESAHVFKLTNPVAEPEVDVDVHD